MQNGKVAGLGDLVYHATQDGAPLGGSGIAAQYVEGEARQALTDDVGACAGLPGQKAGLFKESQRSVQGGLGQIRGLHELGQCDCAARPRQHLEDGKGLERGGRLPRNLGGLHR